MGLATTGPIRLVQQSVQRERSGHLEEVGRTRLRSGIVLAYYIVRIGDPPGISGSDSKGAACAAWSKSEEKEHTEVAEVDLSTRDVLHRYTHFEAEKIANKFLNPSI